MNRMHDIPAERQIEILTARLERSERALRDAETALEKRMTELFRANQDLSLRETELARRLEVESALLLGALSTIQMATLYGERERGVQFFGQRRFALRPAAGRGNDDRQGGGGASPARPPPDHARDVGFLRRVGTGHHARIRAPDRPPRGRRNPLAELVDCPQEG